MKRFSLPLLALPALAIAAPATPPPPHVDVQLRLRWEDRANNLTFDRSLPSTSNDNWLLTRLRVGFAQPLTESLSAYTQLQDAREFGSDRPSVPYVAASEGDDPADLRQLYVDWKTPTATLRLGRQVLSFGDERLVGPVDWNNLARSFDAARLTFPKVGGGLDVFVASVVQIQPTSTTGWHSNHSSTDDLFAGVYSRVTLAPTLKAEPYLLYRNKRSDTVYSVAGVGTARPYDIPQDTATLGLRWLGTPAGPAAKEGFDYDGEFALQLGRVRGRQLAGATTAFPGHAWLDHTAWALHTGIGYTTSTLGAPLRFAAEYNYATGDRDPTDRDDQSFLNLFPTNHKFYGALDAFAWKNLSEFAFSAAATLLSKTKLRFEHHVFALANTNDTWFRANAVTTVRPLTPAARAASRSAGQETDLILTHPLNPHLTLELGGAYFFAGRYLEQTGGASDARFFYLQSVAAW